MGIAMRDPRMLSPSPDKETTVSFYYDIAHGGYVIVRIINLIGFIPNLYRICGNLIYAKMITIK